MTHEVQKQDNSWITPTSFNDAYKLADLIAKSDFCPKGDKGKPGNILLKMQLGVEVGLKTMQALQNIYVINGLPCLYGDSLMALAQTHADCEYVTEEFDSKNIAAICKVKRKGQPEHVTIFSKADAVNAKLWAKAGPWTQYPKRMLQMRARGFALRDKFPDALKGLNSAEEVRDYPKEATKEKVRYSNQPIIVEAEKLEYISEEKADKLYEMILDRDVDYNKFTEYYCIAKLTDLDEDRYLHALKMVESKPLKNDIIDAGEVFEEDIKM